MSRQQKLLQRLLSKPKDFTWNELKTLLNHYGYEMLKGNGSRRKFIHSESKQVISLHEPHPQNIIKMYVIEDVISKLTELGLIDE
ncbi:type II toxin-antitoxin system HicA family toxin [Vibrio sp. 780]|uniref:type II toxin-antitoxin system HicA family toxin n=1 Tax=unclassified Vibrio TaxID=2614977 RepID=UPI002963CB08|nr:MULTISPECIES: type II toxin-antitoxin system HicA family toxin [unclassified Vibrio]MDW1950458.1 type II toxin-antitoxin system HicA family toxin [Vibrio sp. 812(2023)]MDW1991318.1 type II toxin-antitoxin system HicA family toxin [Vibrio sp. 780]